ncbi:MAG: GspH/FimT family protein [Gallionella sp.]|jgi:type IV fimbrial biogenesis protein FimT|nr:GspH/FimT family protein [Gallionella sp.]MCK9355122.1 GspH/FimT family protein [Gallionella sp.]
MQSMQRQTGISMVEVIIVMAIAAILATIAAPSFNDFISNTRLTSTMSQLTSDMNRARSEAIKRNSWILVCARGTDTACGNNWNNGWLICQDSEPNNTCDTGTAANPNPITAHQAINANFVLTGSATSIRFNPNGTGGSGTLNLASGAKSRTANVAATGNISVSNP